jgi:hypothetical protein
MGWRIHLMPASNNMSRLAAGACPAQRVSVVLILFPRLAAQVD